jgi:hypothetical protein
MEGNGIKVFCMFSPQSSSGEVDTLINEYTASIVQGYKTMKVLINEL